MPDQTLTHLAMLLDRSGSMQTIKQATEQGFDLFLTEQREAPGRCTVTLAQFDNEYEEVYTDLDVREVPPLDLRPRGMTALLDSIGRLVQTTALRIAQLPEEQRPGAVIVGIMTDGLENASKEYTHAAIKALVTEREEQFGWTFLYMGANQDAIEVGASLGVKRERSLTYDTANVDQAYAATSRSMAGMRTAMAAGTPPAAARDQHAVYTEADRAAAGSSGSGHASTPTGRRSAASAPVLPTPRGTKDDPFDEQHLLAHVRSVLASGAPTLADVGTFGGRAVVWATVRGVPVFLNADSSRAALQQLVDAAARRPLPWTVIANQSGQLNKVTFRAGEQVPGFYCYTTAVQAAAGPLGGVTAAR
ncbi:VWA domain-containing protein [Cellulosimicrobium sp. TH-20]|uniref:VWA domain-containing protein n=1 Tax=Cellulosimicrobium sp. TH-20 TaxID=1980001 RepID=UPI00164310D0|nr:VWA domain-containing protein [Cellulosimicrobium sp. TH-20]